jgi:predicted ATP-grasp superfamily ATP-dependent carboligase
LSADVLADSIAVAAVSARMMAESAQRGGFITSAIDVFGDVDTRAASDAWWPAGDASKLRIERENLVLALESFSERPNAIGWVAGGGFEASLDALIAGAEVAPLIGNAPSAFEALRKPREFFGRLSVLRIPYPEVAWQLPADRADWLVKDAASSGGWQIHAATEDGDAIEPDGRRYFQRLHPGVPMSALFVANGRAARIVGINALIVERHGLLPYVYHGAIAPVTLSPRTFEQVSSCVEAIVREWRLVGVNGVDFLLDGEHVAVLEINPRPTATLALHDHRTPRGLMHAHVEACMREQLPDVQASDEVGLGGQTIVFAKSAVMMTTVLCDYLQALGFVHDIPSVGTTTPAGAPFCSVSARGGSRADVLSRLNNASGTVLRLVQSTQNTHPPSAEMFIETGAA